MEPDRKDTEPQLKNPVVEELEQQVRRLTTTIRNQRGQLRRLHKSEADWIEKYYGISQKIRLMRQALEVERIAFAKIYGLVFEGKVLPEAWSTNEVEFRIVEPSVVDGSIAAPEGWFYLTSVAVGEQIHTVFARKK